MIKISEIIIYNCPNISSIFGDYNARYLFYFITCHYDIFSHYQKKVKPVLLLLGGVVRVVDQVIK